VRVRLALLQGFGLALKSGVWHNPSVVNICSASRNAPQASLAGTGIRAATPERLPVDRDSQVSGRCARLARAIRGRFRPIPRNKKPLFWGQPRSPRHVSVAPVNSELELFWRWLARIGVSRSTGWRWRRSGVVETVVIGGRVFISRSAETKFLRRAGAGEFRDLEHPR
jgi:hypothetical protein